MGGILERGSTDGTLVSKLPDDVEVILKFSLGVVTRVVRSDEQRAEVRQLNLLVVALGFDSSTSEYTCHDVLWVAFLSEVRQTGTLVSKLPDDVV